MRLGHHAQHFGDHSELLGGACQRQRQVARTVQNAEGQRADHHHVAGGTKLDVLDGLDEIKVCTGYKLDGQVIDYLPASQGAQARVEPIYETLEGWKGTTAGARSWADLPAQAVKYVRYIEELIGAPVALLSTSPEREDTILVTDPFQD